MSNTYLLSSSFFFTKLRLHKDSIACKNSDLDNSLLLGIWQIFMGLF
ncbi:MAG: hypothetical protein O4861_20350 [Trichodesmium sp. St16_bin4-tuft]|nr:hypothetical protein [Trichodesmium sp. MAG_R01]MDE5100554.1 hypothetical protein [Trichodesmium sp. St16_bin4-tuft]